MQYKAPSSYIICYSLLSMAIDRLVGQRDDIHLGLARRVDSIEQSAQEVSLYSTSPQLVPGPPYCGGGCLNAQNRAGRRRDYRGRRRGRRRYINRQQIDSNSSNSTTTTITTTTTIIIIITIIVIATAYSNGLQ